MSARGIVGRFAFAVFAVVAMAYGVYLTLVP